MSSDYTLDRKKLDDALTILGSEIEALSPLIRFQQKSEPRFRFAIYTFYLGLAAIAILLVHEWISLQTAGRVAAAFFVAYFLGLLFFGFRELREFARVRRAQRSIGLDPIKYVSFVGWKEVKVRLVGCIPNFGGVVALIVAFAWYLIDDFNPWILDAGIILFALGQSMFLSFITRRNMMIFRGRLDVAERLQAGLLSQQTSAADTSKDLAISIPAVEYKEIARIERALISRDRERAIKQSSKKVGPSVLAVQQSAVVIERKSSLEPAVRLNIQTRIDELSTNPRPPDAHEDARGTWRLPISETRWEISYELAENPRRIVVHDLSERAESERQL